MTKQLFLRQLVEHGVDGVPISFNNSTAEGYGVRQTYYGWETFVRERGDEYDIRLFATESDALTFLLDEILYLYRNIPRHDIL